MPSPFPWDLLMVLAECHSGLELSGTIPERNIYPAGFCLVPDPLLHSWLGEQEAKTPQRMWRFAPIWHKEICLPGPSDLIRNILACAQREGKETEFFSRKGFLVDLEMACRRNLVWCCSVRGWGTSRLFLEQVPDPARVSTAGAALCSQPGLRTGAEPLYQHNAEPPAQGLIWRDNKCILQLWIPS